MRGRSPEIGNNFKDFVVTDLDAVTFDNCRSQRHDGPDEQPSGLGSLPGEAAVLRGRAEQLLAHVEDHLAAGVRDAQRGQSENDCLAILMAV